MKNKIKAETNIAVGKVKEKVGEAIGNPSLKEEGTRDRMKGNMQNIVGSVKDAGKAALNK